MSTQVKRLKVYTKNHSARIRTKKYACGDLVTSTYRREDDEFRVALAENAKDGQTLVISNVLPGSSEAVVLNGRQIRTLRRVLDKHFYNL